MTEVLLKELSRSDLDWILANSYSREIAAGTVIDRESQKFDTVDLLIEGNLVTTISQYETNTTPNNTPNNRNGSKVDRLARAFAAIEGTNDLSVELFHLSMGEVVGEIPLVGLRPDATSIKALQRSLLQSIPKQSLTSKLEEDVGFAARFYRAIAIMYADRLANAIAKFSNRKLARNEAIPDVLFILGELHDSDIDWLVNVGNRQKISANTTAIEQGCPIDALQIVLYGKMAMSFSEGGRNPLSRLFASFDELNMSEVEIGRLSRGEIIGETPFLDGRLPAFSVRAIEDCLVLSVARQHFASKLQQDYGFASRFYRVISTLLADRLQDLIGRLGYGRRFYRQSEPLHEQVKYEDELSIGFLDRMTLAGARFDWILEHSH
jgi:bacteriocin-type transport-associated protein